MDIELTIKNYRCFPMTNPARVVMRQGFIAFVGVNNSGKSSLLKFFHEFRQVFQILGNPGNYRDLMELDYTQGGMQHFAVQLLGPVVDRSEVFSRLNELEIQIEVKLLGLAGDGANMDIATRIVATVARQELRVTCKVFRGGQELNAMNAISVVGNQIHRENRPAADLLPITSAVARLANTFYVGPFRNVINLGGSTAYFDINVGQPFIARWKVLQTGPSNKENEAAYQVVEDVRRIFGYERLQVNASSDEQTLQLMVNGRSYRLSELGSGLAQFLMVLANAAARAPKPSYILIDEPELNLHPSLQIEFLTTLASYATDGVLFATHNLGLARASADLIYSLRKSAEGTSDILPYEATPRLSEFLGELSFAGYKELGVETVLLVEGPTDVKAIQILLRQYRKDHKVVILPMGGFQWITGGVQSQLEEVKRITGDVHVLIDSERKALHEPIETKRQQFVAECAKAAIHCHILERRALENYFSDVAVRSFGGAKFRALASYERLNELENGWHKSDNWRIAMHMSRTDLDSSDLGGFLQTLGESTSS